MARKPDIQYVRYYTDGSAARQLEILSPRKHKAAYPRTKKQPSYVIYIDPLAVAQQQLSDMKAYVTTLSQSNEELRKTYEEGYDLAEVEKSALALGMIPADQGSTIFVEVEEEQIVEEPTFWQRLSVKLEELFA